MFDPGAGAVTLIRGVLDFFACVFHCFTTRQKQGAHKQKGCDFKRFHVLPPFR